MNNSEKHQTQKPTNQTYQQTQHIPETVSDSLWLFRHFVTILTVHERELYMCSNYLSWRFSEQLFIGNCHSMLYICYIILILLNNCNST